MCWPPPKILQIRDGKTALVLAAKANALTGGAQPFVLDALGMALRGNRRFHQRAGRHAKGP